MSDGLVYAIDFDFEEADKQIRMIAKLEAGRGRRNMCLGWWGARMAAANEWQQHGYADEAAYRDAAGVTVGVWGRYCRIAECFPQLDLARFVLMTAENAEQLGRLPEPLRYEPMWLEDAMKMEAEEFRKKVLTVQAGLKGVPVAEMRVKFSLPLFENQRTVIEEGITEFQKDHGIKDRGTALEWMVMEVSGRQTFAKFLRQQLPLLRERCRLEDADSLRGAITMHIVAVNDMLETLKGMME